MCQCVGVYVRVFSQCVGVSGCFVSVWVCQCVLSVCGCVSASQSVCQCVGVSVYVCQGVLSVCGCVRGFCQCVGVGSLDGLVS